MKFEKEHFTSLKEAITSKLKLEGITIADYLKAAEGYSETRMLWDLFWFSGWSKLDENRAFNYLDSHIQTALKQAVKELSAEHAAQPQTVSSPEPGSMKAEIEVCRKDFEMLLGKFNNELDKSGVKSDKIRDLKTLNAELLEALKIAFSTMGSLFHDGSISKNEMDKIESAIQKADGAN